MEKIAKFLRYLRFTQSRFPIALTHIHPSGIFGAVAKKANSHLFPKYVLLKTCQEERAMKKDLYFLASVACVLALFVGWGVLNSFSLNLFALAR